MKTRSIDLDFVSVAPFGGKESPTMQHAYILLKTYTSNKTGKIFITHECMSVRELESEIDRLIEELEEIRETARRKFAAANRRNQSRTGETP